MKLKDDENFKWFMKVNDWMVDNLCEPLGDEGYSIAEAILARIKGLDK